MLVILAVTVAVGLPAYLAQVSTARVNAANAAVMAAAKACAVAQVTDNFDSNYTNAGLVGSCGDTSVNRASPPPPACLISPPQPWAAWLVALASSSWLVLPDKAVLAAI